MHLIARSTFFRMFLATLSIALLATLISVTTSWMATRPLSSHALPMTVALAEASEAVHSVLAESREYVIGHEEEDVLEDLAEQIEAGRLALQRYLEIAHTAEELQTGEELKRLSAQSGELATKLVEAVDRAPVRSRLTDPTVLDVLEELEELEEPLSEHLAFAQHLALEERAEATAMIQRAAVAAVVVCLLIAAALAWAMSYSMAGPISRLIAAAERMAQGDLQPLETHTEKGDLGRIAAALEVLREAWVSSIARVRGHAAIVDRSSTQLAAAAGGFSAGAQEWTGDVDAAIERVKTLATGLGSAVSAWELADRTGAAGSVHAGDAAKALEQLRGELGAGADRAPDTAGPPALHRLTQLVEDISDDLRETVAVVAEATRTTRSQEGEASGLEGTMTQLRAVTRRNLSAAEEVTACASDLADQASGLREAVGFFRTPESSEAEA